MDIKPYIIAGHSHIFALGAPGGYKGRIGLVPSGDGAGHFLMEESTLGRTNEFWETLIEVCSGFDVLLVYAGNQHHSEFLFAPDPLFDFFDPDTPALLEGATFVPRRLVEAFFYPSLEGLRALVPRLLAAGCRSVRLVGTPPPKSDIQAFETMIRESRFATRFAARTGVDIRRARITPAPLLLKLWRVVQLVTAQVPADERCAFVGVPSVAFDESGFLARPFYDYVPTQVTHANRAFGDVMLRHVLATLRN